MAKHGDDCYYFYYSTCNKGPKCPYRHCEAALGTEIVCKNWLKFGLCRKADCPFRHMQIDKFRSSTPCYWETQPGGCRKPHCVFKHKMARNEFGTVLTDNHSTDTRTGGLPDPVEKASLREHTPCPSEQNPAVSLEPEESPVVVVKGKSGTEKPVFAVDIIQKRSVIMPSIEMHQPGLEKVRQVVSNRVVLPSTFCQIEQKPFSRTEQDSNFSYADADNNYEPLEGKTILPGDLREKLSLKRREKPVVALEELQCVPLFEEKESDSSLSDFVQVFRSSKKRPITTEKSGSKAPVKLKRRWLGIIHKLPTSNQEEQKTDTSSTDNAELEKHGSLSDMEGSYLDVSDVSDNQIKDLLPSSPPVVSSDESGAKNDNSGASATNTQNEAEVSAEYKERMVQAFGEDLATQFMAQGIKFDIDELELERKRRSSEGN